MTAMLQGHFEEAWRESDAIRLRGRKDPHRFWNGEDLHGKRVIVRCLHGLGDAIQFLRYAPRLRDIASELVIEVPPGLLDIALLFDGVNQAVTWGQMAPSASPVWDVQVEVMELPYLFRTALEDLPLAVEYLRVPRREVEHAAQVIGGTKDLRVGVVWASGEWNQARSVALERMEQLLLSGCAEFWSLQGGTAQEDAHDWVSAGLMRDASECGTGLKNLAAVIANLDLVISVDTLAPHLAGAMGKPAWILLQHAADWRWMTKRCDNPWYPKAHLFRQTEEGDWDGVLGQVATQLTALSLRHRSNMLREVGSS